MKAFLSVKFREDSSNRDLIEEIADSLEKSGFHTTVMARDKEKWGEEKITPRELMELTFESIDESDIVVAEFSEKGTGLGIEAGYAFSKQKPVIVIAREGSEISGTLKGIAREIIYYKETGEIGPKIRSIVH